MTNEEKIRTATQEQLCLLLISAENMSVVPKRWGCDKINCIMCEDGFSCFKTWLEEEARSE